MEAASLIVHIAAGSLAILAGYVAIFAAKGGGLHRSSGMLFVYAMVVMGMTATAVAAFRGIPGSLLGGPLAAYFVITAVTAVRPIHRRLDLAMLVVALVIIALSYSRAASALSQGRFTINGVPVAMTLFLASVLLLAALSDIRGLRGAAPVGPRRIARHLWRMCFAFWIATGSFFFGQMDEFPAWLQKPALVAVPALLPLVLMVFWLWRIRVRRLLAGLVLRPG
jgi:hypothetical protein